MSAPVKFFKYPWAESGDKTAIPNPIQPDGSVSMQQGWSPPYSQNPVNPTARFVPRLQSNQALYDVTNALQQYQTYGTPFFITTADNDGAPYPYAKYARVLYDDGGGMKEYVSLENANTSLPTDATKWAQLALSGNSVYLSDVVFDAPVATGNVVAFDATTGEFKQAIATGTFLNDVVGIADVASNRVLLLGVFEGLTGLTLNAVYYLSDTVLGGITTTQPAQYVVRLGTAFSATSLFVNPQNIYVPFVLTLTTSGSFVVPQDVYKIFTSGTAGGGGGGGSGGVGQITATGSLATGGAGGGGAATSTYKTPLAVIPGETLTYSIGAAGSAGSAGAIGGDGGDGGDGGVTALFRGVTALLTLAPGLGGKKSTTTTANAGELGGDGGNNGGAPGEMGLHMATGATPTLSSIGGHGGSGGNNTWGVSGRGAKNTATLTDNVTNPGIAGQNGVGYGSGGGGASGASNQRVSGATIAGNVGAIGGQGAPGVLIIEY